MATKVQVDTFGGVKDVGSRMGDCDDCFFTVALVILQVFQHHHDKRVARANYMLALHERRMEIFNAIEDMFGEFWREGQPSMEAASKLRHAARNAEFIFPEEPLQFMEEIVTKSFEHRRATTKWEPLRARSWDGEPLSPEEVEQRNQALEKRTAVENWFHQQSDDGRLKREFGPYLKLPESI